MTSDPCKEIVNRMIEEIQNKKNIELCDELFSADFVNHTAPPNFPSNRAGMRRLFSMVHEAFPDGRITVEDQTSDSSKVWTRKTFTGTHTGPFGTMAPTGKVVTYQVIDILAIEGGQMREHWHVVDRLDLFRQLGAIK